MSRAQREAAHGAQHCKPNWGKSKMHQVLPLPPKSLNILWKFGLNSFQVRVTFSPNFGLGLLSGFGEKVDSKKKEKKCKHKASLTSRRVV